MKLVRLLAAVLAGAATLVLPRRRPVVLIPRRRCWEFLRSRLRNEPPSRDGKPNGLRFAR